MAPVAATSASRTAHPLLPRARTPHRLDSNPLDTSPVANVHRMNARGKASARVAGEVVQISLLSEELTAYLARDDDRADRAARDAAEQAAAAQVSARDWLTLPETCRVTGSSRKVLLRCIERRLLGAVQPGGQDSHYQVPVAALLAYVRQLRLPPDRVTQIEQAIARTLVVAS